MVKPCFIRAVVVMGVTSCGKTSVGEALAEELGVRFIEGDKLHPEANVKKMSSGTPLTDEDRWPWLQTIGTELSGTEGAVASCSALKKAYRDALREAAGRPVFFVFLHGTPELLRQRIDARKGHFMPPSLLESQLATLEPPAHPEQFVALDIARPVPDIVAAAVRSLAG
jgi:gluconokinase